MKNFLIIEMLLKKYLVSYNVYTDVVKLKSSLFFFAKKNCFVTFIKYSKRKKLLKLLENPKYMMSIIIFINCSKRNIIICILVL